MFVSRHFVAKNGYHREVNNKYLDDGRRFFMRVVPSIYNPHQIYITLSKKSKNISLVVPKKHQMQICVYIAYSENVCLPFS